MLIGLVYAFNDRILSLFVTDPAVVATAHELLAITLWSYLLFGTSSVLSGLMRSSGTVLWPTLLSIVGDLGGRSARRVRARAAARAARRVDRVPRRVRVRA